MKESPLLTKTRTCFCTNLRHCFYRNILDGRNYSAVLFWISVRLGISSFRPNFPFLYIFSGVIEIEHRLEVSCKVTQLKYFFKIRNKNTSKLLYQVYGTKTADVILASLLLTQDTLNVLLQCFYF